MSKGYDFMIGFAGFTFLFAEFASWNILVTSVVGGLIVGLMFMQGKQQQRELNQLKGEYV